MISASALTLTREGKVIIRDFNVEIHPGRALAVIGANGSGKSTLISALVGDLRPTRGSITLNDRNLNEFSFRELAQIRSVSSQQQRFSLAYRVEEVLKMSISYSGDLESIARAVEALQIADLLKRSVISLSGGEQQRVSIAMALAQKSSYIFLDEPFSAQDIESTQRITNVLQEFVQEGKAVVVVAHMSLKELSWCDQRFQLGES